MGASAPPGSLVGGGQIGYTAAMQSWVRLIAVLSIAFSASVCHTMRFEIDEVPHKRVVQERKSYFLFGLVPTRRVDVHEHCPEGVVAVKEERTFTDGLFELLTLDIWTPRSTTFYCGARE